MANFGVHCLEKEWQLISGNLQNVLEHLNSCSNQVTSATVNCLDSFEQNIQLTCDRLTEQMESLYRLISKCDELTIILGLVEDFREETRALRKSVETLEALFKSRPRPDAVQDSAR